ncbi:hypothetical protein H181DRAFT_04076 [Streptomyces sp. WMMB 714]|uniref:hypothetical protein n=1 Tax=Streptomyces sp. WMMB 714 TaxID=1286822 RepID=UPI0005F8252D|nr:hypothetical protein [Streptomyces sp. WMMB 714]SCK45964.1 hypothetical protein H181DRAFT_04076 [Streptomyces sp. WMMB 714]
MADSTRPSERDDDVQRPVAGDHKTPDPVDGSGDVPPCGRHEGPDRGVAQRRARIWLIAKAVAWIIRILVAVHNDGE